MVNLTAVSENEYTKKPYLRRKKINKGRKYFEGFKRTKIIIQKEKK